MKIVFWPLKAKKRIKGFLIEITTCTKQFTMNRDKEEDKSPPN